MSEHVPSCADLDQRIDEIWCQKIKGWEQLQERLATYASGGIEIDIGQWLTATLREQERSTGVAKGLRQAVHALRITEDVLSHHAIDYRHTEPARLSLAQTLDLWEKGVGP